MDEEFRQERLRHLQTIATYQGMSPLDESHLDDACTHYSSLNFLNIVDDAEGNYWEYWDCPICGRIKSIPYNAGGITF